MEDKLKEVILAALEIELDCPVEVTPAEWELAKLDTLNDVYCNNVCSLRNTPLDYFINTMVTMLAVMKRVIA